MFGDWTPVSVPCGGCEMKILYCSFGVTNWSLDGASGLENWAGGILGELTNPILGELIIELLEGGGASKGIESFSGGDRITSFIIYTHRRFQVCS